MEQKQITIPGIDVPSDDPFKNDLLGRKAEIDNLINLITKIKSPLVLAIDSPWGTGKTTFINMWAEHLVSQQISSIYFNAWESDYSQDPFLAFMGEMEATFCDFTLWKDTSIVGQHLLSRIATIGGKFVTGGSLDLDDERTRAQKAFTSDAIQYYIDTMREVDNFKEKFLKFLHDQNENASPLVIFVDELDRCRPTYAIELLERIKHILDIEGLIFVLSLDKQQLEHSIKAQYGVGFDANSYLKRFIDLDYHLKQRKRFLTGVLTNREQCCHPPSKHERR